MRVNAARPDINNTSAPDGLLAFRLSRRSFAALVCAGILALEGCAKDSPEPEDELEDEFEDEPAGEISAEEDGMSTEAQSSFSLSTFAFNTLCSFTAYGIDDDSILRECSKDCAHYEALFSAHKEGSDIDRLNQAQGALVEVDEDTADLLTCAYEIARLSDGAFDPTIGAVSLLWDFVEAIKPEDTQITEALSHVGWSKLHIEGTQVYLEDPASKIDLGGIAKGWIADRLASKLVDAGCTAALISLGSSSIVAIGSKPGGIPWKIGLRDPFSESTASYYATIEVSDVSITSSGLYEQEFESDGIWYWHILDPQTGYPVKTDVVADTLINTDAGISDALSTVLFVKGSTAAQSWMEQTWPQVSAVLVRDDATELVMGEFENYGYTRLEG